VKLITLDLVGDQKPDEGCAVLKTVHFGPIVGEPLETGIRRTTTTLP